MCVEDRRHNDRTRDRDRGIKVQKVSEISLTKRKKVERLKKRGKGEGVTEAENNSNKYTCEIVFDFS